MMYKINKSLFKIAENIALKEIEKDPLEFIRRESFIDPNIYKQNEANRSGLAANKSLKY